MKFAVIITLKKDVLDPQGKVIKQTLEGMGVNNLKNLRQGKYIEIESSSEKPVLVEIPRNYASAHINLHDDVSIILALVEPAWRPENRDEHNITFDDYDWEKWNIKNNN